MARAGTKICYSKKPVLILWKEVIQCRVIYAWSLRVVMFFVQHGLTFRRTKTSIL